MNRSQRITTGLLLLLTILCAAACGGSRNDDATRDAGPTPHSTSVVSGHDGPRASRCSVCHSPADRAHPQWKSTAKRVGHDIDRLMKERTSCTCCHLGEVRGFGEPFDRACLSCHDAVKVTIPAMAAQHCVACHTLDKDAGRDLKEGAWECQKCHAEAHGDKAAIVVHGKVSCVECHHPHTEPWVSPRTCTDCHAAETTRHGAAPHGKGTQACDDCHQPHERAGEASGRCTTCHEDHDRAIGARAGPGGHDRCTSCHAPHDFNRAGAAKCAQCHTDVKTMGGRGAAQHADCRSCHDPHRAEKPTAAACTQCHASLHARHPDPKGSSCLGCHDPHPPKATTLATVACSSCHTRAKSDAAFHAGQVACTGCHAQHDFKLKDCASCHAGEVSASRETRATGTARPATARMSPKRSRPVRRATQPRRARRRQREATRTAPAATMRTAERGYRQRRRVRNAIEQRHRPARCPRRVQFLSSPARALGTRGASRLLDVPPNCQAQRDARAKGAPALRRLPHGARETTERPRHLLGLPSTLANHEPTAKVCAGCHGF